MNKHYLSTYFWIHTLAAFTWLMTMHFQISCVAYPTCVMTGLMIILHNFLYYTSITKNHLSHHLMMSWSSLSSSASGSVAGAVSLSSSASSSSRWSANSSSRSCSSSIRSSSSSIRRSSTSSSNKDTQEDEEFSVMLANSDYYAFKNSKVVYEVYLQHKKLHWFLLLKMKDSELRYLTLEATTPNLSDLTRVMFMLDSSYGEKVTYCGIIKDSISSIVKVADKIIEKMGHYSLFSSNCQHFCNNFLNHYGLPVQRTTLGAEVSATVEKEPASTPEQRAIVDDLHQHVSAFPYDSYYSQAANATLQAIEGRLRAHFARVLNSYVGAYH